MEDVLAVAPFQNTIDIVELKGVHVKEMFEQSVRKYDHTGMSAPGGFLQVSGEWQAGVHVAGWGGGVLQQLSSVM